MVNLWTECKEIDENAAVPFDEFSRAIADNYCSVLNENVLSRKLRETKFYIVLKSKTNVKNFLIDEGTQLFEQLFSSIRNVTTTAARIVGSRN